MKLPSLKVATGALTEAVDITGRVAEALAGAGDGLAFVSIRHTSAALLISPADDEVRRDLARVAERWLEPVGPLEHNEENNPNGPAHILSAFGGTQVLVGLAAGKLELGTFQKIVLLEMDGPKERTVDLRFLPGA